MLDKILIVTGILILIVTVYGLLLGSNIGIKPKAKGCRNCKYLGVDCQGRTYCEAWEELE